MPATVTERRIEKPSSFRSSDAAFFIGSLDDQTRLLFENLKDITPDELQWQPAPGMNTIGMLLAHLALVEVWWTRIIVEKVAKPSVTPIIGIGDDDDGMPIAPGAKPIALLNGKDLAYYRGLMDKARDYVRRMTSGLTDADLDATTMRQRDDGSTSAITGRWYLYHVLEHFSGHYGQILLLRHMYRDAKARG